MPRSSPEGQKTPGRESDSSAVSLEINSTEIKYSRNETSLKAASTTGLPPGRTRNFPLARGKRKSQGAARALLCWPFPCCSPELLPGTDGAWGGQRHPRADSRSLGAPKGGPERRAGRRGVPSMAQSCHPGAQRLGRAQQEVHEATGGGAWGAAGKTSSWRGASPAPPPCCCAARGSLGAAAPAARRDSPLPRLARGVLANGWEHHASSPHLFPRKGKKKKSNHALPASSLAIGTL